MAAAIQVDTQVGDTQKNLEKCHDLALRAVHQGAQWIALPEFFNSGVLWDPKFVKMIEDEHGPSATFLRTFSKQHSVVIGGSFMCRVPQGGVRNRYLCFDNGKLVGRHDKDYPTMWENAFYEGGDGDDIGELGVVNGARVGSAMCWEFLRTATAKRLKGKVDVIMGGSHWWSLPTNWPTWLTRKSEEYNNFNAIKCVQETARLIGAPAIVGSHCYEFSCKTPGAPLLDYSGYLEGNAAIIDAHGKVLAKRTKEEGGGMVMAKVTLGAIHCGDEVPKGFWLRRRGLMAILSWHFHGALGRRWYKQNVL